ncbi:MAG TPA: GGDEF domain-containing protein [Woeseiaceae bacterium]|nr:GGDEF domain-containing protein [Woeseiaceae bacterium]
MILRRLNELFADQSVFSIGGLSFALILLLAGIDRMTGYELSVSVFYLIPIGLATWYGSRHLGYIVSGLSAGTWLVVEQATAEPYSHDWIIFWNSAVRLMAFAIVAFLLAELRTLLQRQQELARTDSLTGLLNRTGFFERATVATTSASRYGHGIAIAYIDLDGFKNINDTEGHQQGDVVLKTMGRLLEGLSRGSDVVARIGGDEFVVMLPNTSLAGARAYFEKMQAELQLEMRQQGWKSLGLSIGAIFFEKAPEDIFEALRLADMLMYRAKRSVNSAVIVERAAPVPAAVLRTASVDI